MKFDTPATTNPIDQLKIVGQPVDRIEGPLKTTGTRAYAYERDDVAPNAAYGYIVGAAIAKGRIVSIDAPRRKGVAGRARRRDGRERRQARQGVDQCGPAARRPGRRALPPGGRARRRRDVRAGARRRRHWSRSPMTAPRAPSISASAKDTAGRRPRSREPESAVGDFEAAFAAAPVQLDETYTTPDQRHAMMEPHASTAVWNGDHLTVWTSNQLIDRGQNGSRDDARHSEGEGAAGVALCRRRLRRQAVSARGRGSGGARGARARPAGQGGAAAPV